MKCLICHEAKMTCEDTTLGLEADDVFDVCDSCRADAALGRAVRRMVVHPNPVSLRVYGGQWTVEQEEMCEDGQVRCYPMHEGTEDQPEAALAAAGLVEVGK